MSKNKKQTPSRLKTAKKQRIRIAKDNYDRKHKSVVKKVKEAIGL